MCARACRRANANRLNGIDAEWLDAAAVKRFCPILDISSEARYPVLGATLQRRGGVARHDAVAWGYARAADARGVDIIENCEVTAIRTANGPRHRCRDQPRRDRCREDRDRRGGA